MAETRGFEVVAEVTETVLQEMLRAAWDNGGTSDPGAIPHEVPIPAGTSLGPYAASGGQVTIPRAGLSLAMAPAFINSSSFITLTLPAVSKVEISLRPNRSKNFLHWANAWGWE